MPKRKGPRVMVTGSSLPLGEAVAALLEKKGATVGRFDVAPGEGISESVYLGLLNGRPDAVVHLDRSIDRGPSGFADRLVADIALARGCAVAGAHFVTCGSVHYHPGGKEVFTERDFLSRGVVGGLEQAMWADTALLAALSGFFGPEGDATYLVFDDLYGAPDTSGMPSFLMGLMGVLKDAARQSLPELRLRMAEGEKRRFLHLFDAARAVALVLEKRPPHRVLNVPGAGPEDLPAVAGGIASLIGYQGDILWERNAEKPGLLDGKLSDDALGWKPEIGVERGLSLTLGKPVSAERK